MTQDCLPYDERGIYAMASREGDAAVAAAVAELRALEAEGALQTPEDVRRALRARLDVVEAREATSAAA